MAQKLILCECSVGTDILQSPLLADHIANGYEVTSVSGYSSRDNRHMVHVLLSEPASDAADPTEDTEPTEPAAGGEEETT